MKHFTLRRLACRSNRRRARTMLLPLAALLLTAGPAAAQKVAEAKEVNGLGGVMLSLLILIAVIVASFMSPRRGSQD